MKRKFTQLCFVVMFMLFAGKNYAATITATVSGNWSNATTWSGGAAGSTVGGLDNIVIPAGITVTLDMNVQVTSLLSSISVSGSLNSTNSHSLMINSGTLSGNGTMNLHYLELGAVGGMSFTGGLTVNRFVTSATSLNLASQVSLLDTICLKAGTLTLGNGSSLNMNTNSNIKIEDGTLAISGGVFMGTNVYNIVYVGSSKTTGIEWNGTGATNAYIQLSSATQSLTLASDMTVNGTLHHEMGVLKLNGNSLTLNGDYMSTNNATLEGSQTSDLMINSPGSLSSNIMFSTATGASALNDLHLNTASTSNVVNIGSDVTIYGDLNLEKGKVNMMNNSTITMNAGSDIILDYGLLTIAPGSTFNGTASYNVRYVGINKVGGKELTGSGLNNLDLDLTSYNFDLMLSSNVVVNGTLMLNRGSLGLNTHNLEIKGNLSSQANGHIKGDAASDLTINTTAGLNDTLTFFGASTMVLHNLSINTGNGSNVMLGSDLIVENISFVDGGITIYNDDLMLNSTGTISGYDANNYVAIKGTGSLMMNVNSSSPFVTFPVGTLTSYAPAHIQKISGANGMMGVNTHNGVWAMGTSGTNYASMASIVDRTWDITSASSGSMNYNMKLEWGTAMEVNGFNRNSAYISQYTSNWDAIAAASSTTTGTGMYMLQRNGLTSPGQFAVVDNLSSVSVTEIEAGTVSFYPNPATEAVTMTVKNLNNYSIEVFDAVGNTVVSKVLSSEPSVKVDLSSLNTGIYFVKISDGKTQSIKKIVKQ